MSDFYTPESIVNEALDAAALDLTVGNLQEGSRQAQISLRKYSTCMHQLLRCAHWGFARKQAPLQLVADASGQTANVGSLVPGPFQYSYNLPTDCLKIRYIPLNYLTQTPPIPASNIVPSDSAAPISTANGPPWYRQAIVPTRFLVTNDVNYIPEGAANNIPGSSPIGQTLILSNQQNAMGVYTFNASYPNLWDDLFRGAMVAFLAAEIVLPLAKDKKFGVAMRNSNIAIAKEKIREARATSANEAGTNSSDLTVDWMRVRMVGSFNSAYGWGGGAGPGYLFGGFDGVWFENSSAY